MSAVAKLFKGLVSKTDEALGNLKREKGTGAEFLRELEKAPGVKPAEIKDRGLDKVLPAMGKTTKAEVKKVLEKNPPPRIEETVLGGKKQISDADVEREYRRIYGDPYTSDGERLDISEMRDMVTSETSGVGSRLAPKYGEYQLPGGQNYREILLKLPRRDEDLGQLNYHSQHWEGEPNVLAHARVSDRVGPNGEKILHVEEIQSDWHQSGRKQGYQTPEKRAEEKERFGAKLKAKVELEEIQRKYNEAKQFSQSLDAKIASPEFDALPADKQAQFRESAKSWGEAWLSKLPELMKARKVYEDIPDVNEATRTMVPDAPFKKNWHELTMKRLLNYAAENNYDRMAITPGQTQADRFGLSNVIDEINVTGRTDAVTGEKSKSVALDTKSGVSLRLGVAPDGTIDNVSDPLISNYIGKNLDEVIGKELSQKVMQGNTQTIAGENLKVGGEGMKGFYDKILPDYLNSLGKPYGAQVSMEGMPVTNIVFKDRIRVPQTTNLHEFPITPQMRQEIIGKGLPLYSVPAIEGAALTGAGAATLGATEKIEEEKAPVHISDNPDTMRLELEDKQMAGGGIARALKEAAKAAKEVPPALPRAAAKTKAEIEAIAERIAPQVTGEFVRKPGKTASVADKSRKQFERERDLPVELTAPESQLTPSALDIEKLKGNVVIGVPGDPTITGRSLVGVGDYRLESPSPQHGGPLYGLGREDEFWASGIGPATRVQNLAAEASQQYGGAPVLGKYVMMGPESINYAQHFADANLQAIDLSKMTKSQIEGFNKILKEGSPKSGPRPSFSGIENKDEAYLWFAMDPEFRKHFNAVMQQPTITEKFGLPSGVDIRYAITEPSLRNLETGVTGFSVGKLRPEVEPSGLKLSTHPTYSHDIPGEFMGKMPYPAPYELSFPDTLRAVRENPAQAPQEFGSLKMVGPRQIIDQQMIDELKAYGEAMKRLTGKKKGGEVNKKGKVQVSSKADVMLLELKSKRK